MMSALSTLGSALGLLMISFIPNAEGAVNVHNAISAILLQYCGFYLSPCLMLPMINIPYFLSFGKYAYEGLIKNEFATPQQGTMFLWYDSLFHSLDPLLTKWTNLLILMIFPFIFHALALAFSFLNTRPKSFWKKWEDRAHDWFPKTYRRRENLAHADPAYRLSAQLSNVSSVDMESVAVCMPDQVPAPPGGEAPGDGGPSP